MMALPLSTRLRGVVISASGCGVVLFGTAGSGSGVGANPLE